MRVRIELAIVVDEKLRTIKNDWLRVETETIADLAKAVEEYKKQFLAMNPHITCSVFATAKLALTV